MHPAVLAAGHLGGSGAAGLQIHRIATARIASRRSGVRDLRQDSPGALGLAEGRLSLRGLSGSAIGVKKSKVPALVGVGLAIAAVVAIVKWRNKGRRGGRFAVARPAPAPIAAK
jgi:hypothetical protein